MQKMFACFVALACQFFVKVTGIHIIKYVHLKRVAVDRLKKTRLDTWLFNKTGFFLVFYS